jgi:hypothetical protein
MWAFRPACRKNNVILRVCLQGFEAAYALLRKAPVTRLREILLVATTGVSVVFVAACSAPAGEAPLARSRSSALTNSLAAPAPTNDAIDEQKARTAETTKEGRTDDLHSRCPRSMVDIEGRFCIDRYEASLVDVLANGEERAQ